MDIDASFAPADWFREPTHVVPFQQLGGVMPAKRPNMEFLDFSNTWLLANNVESRPPIERQLIVGPEGARPATLAVPGQLPSRCQTANDALIREQVTPQKEAPAPAAPSGLLQLLAQGARDAPVSAPVPALSDRKTVALVSAPTCQLGSNSYVLLSVGLVLLLVALLVILNNYRLW